MKPFSQAAFVTATYRVQGNVEIGSDPFGNPLTLWFPETPPLGGHKGLSPLLETQ